MRSSVINVGGREIEIPRARLRTWFELERIRRKIKEASERGEAATVSDLLCVYLSTASGESEDVFASAPWYETAIAFGLVSALNMSTVNFPLFRNTVSTGKEVPWNYEGRDWYEWVHVLALAYGWTLDVISELEIEDGIALLQEVLTDEQLDREWMWSMSENAYEYIPSSKKSKFRPLPRPAWMLPLPSMPQSVKIRKDMLPVGKVIDLANIVH